MIVPPSSRFTRYLLVLVRWLLIGSTVFVVTAWIGLNVTDDLFPETYTATALMQVPPADLVIPHGAPNPTSATFQPMFELTIRAPDFLLPVIKDLDLETSWAHRLSTTDQEEVPDVDALTRMEDLLTFKTLNGTNIVAIIVSSNDPKEAADIANAIAQKYAASHASPPPVRVLSPAEIPLAPTRPNRSLAFDVTMTTAALFGLLAASFAEVVLLFVRASQRIDN
jgi:uncharacterized protein involved in exopolysaccharide biosynthesis